MRKVTVRGRVLFANGKPAPGVEARVFEADDPRKRNPDDDLTIRPGRTGSDGRFTIEFDMELNKERIDLFIPYLRLAYALNESPREHKRTIVFMPNIQTDIDAGDIVLPEHEPVHFSVLNHGFRFVNCFKGIALPFDLPIEAFDSQYHGLCGGMTYACADFAIFKKQVPLTVDTPMKDTSLYHYLFHRQLDSFGFAFSNIFTLQKWMRRPDNTIKGIHKAARDEFNRIKNKLDAGQLVPLYVVLDRKVTWNNHQVLAYGYATIDESDVSIAVYDPNYPGNEHVVIRCADIDAGMNPGISGYACRIVDTRYPNNALYENCFGFFDSGYVPKFPPPVL